MACRYTYKGKTYSASEFDDLLRAMPMAEASKFMPGVESLPAAPFVDKTPAWVALALKRMIRYAAENGFDRVAWTTGLQQINRYPEALRQVADHISWKASEETNREVRINKDGKLIVRATVSKDGKVLDSNESKAFGKDLSELIGKPMAERVLREQTGEIKGQDFVVGGKGMQDFYDKIVPNVANDVLKKLGGGRVGEVKIETPALESDQDAAVRTRAGRDIAIRTQQAIDITPALREKAMQGMPLFAKGAPGSGLTESALRQSISEAFGEKAAERLLADIIVPIADQSQLPEHVAPLAREGDKIYGFYDAETNKTYAVLSNLSPDMVRGFVLHEVGVHYGMGRMLGSDKYAQVLKRMDFMAKAGNKAVMEARAEAERNAATPEQIPEEEIAYLVQNHPTMSFVREIIAAIKAFLFREFGILGSKLNESDIVALAHAAVRRAGNEQAGYWEGPGGEFTETDTAPSMGERASELFNDRRWYPYARSDKGVKLARASDQTETPAFKRWFGDSKAVTPVDPKLKREGEEYEGRLFGGAYNWTRIEGPRPEAARDAPIHKMISQARERYNAIREQLGLSTVADWTKRPADLVQHAKGKPLVVYHGTTAEITAFMPQVTGRRTGNQYGKGAIFFTSNRNAASAYALPPSGGGGFQEMHPQDEPNVIPAYLALQNPLEIDAEDRSWLHVKDRIAGAQKRGYDGVIVRNVLDHASAVTAVNEGPVDVFVAFRPEQIKSSIGNRGTFDPGSPDIRFSRAGNRASWDAPEPGKLDAFVRVLQDKHIDSKRVLTAIRNASGALSDAVDVYLQEELFHGRAAKGVQEFLDTELRPLFTDMSGRGVTMPELEEYLHARHAEEANEHIAAINPDLPDGGSGMDTADARAYLAGLDPAKKRSYEALAGRVDAINAKTRQTLVDYGLESQETVTGWTQMFDHYVPLHREDMGDGPGTGQGFSVRGPASKSRTGSKRNVVDILANIAMQRERSIVRGEKNRVAVGLIGLATANPNPDFWRIDQPPMIQRIDERTGVLRKMVDPTYKSRENVVVARIPEANGEIREHAVIFNEHDDRASRMAAALKNLDANDLGEVLGLSAKITRYFASINTQYNPVFGVVNLIRDTQGALFNLSTTAISGKQAEVLKHTISALRGIYIDSRAARQSQQPASSWAHLWDEFQREGGQTGYRDMFRTSKDRADSIRREIAKVTEGKAKHLGRAVFDWLSDYNQAMENAVRLAAYKVGKESGMTNQRAASMAKNLTVNFNRRGQIGTQAGALYAFFNASVQGTARMIETLKGPMGKKIITGGLLFGSMQALLLAAAGFDDNEPPDFVRERNLIIPIGGKKYITIPLPLGLHILPNLGRLPTEFVLSGFRDPQKRILQLANVFTEAFNPIGNAGLSLQTIAPTVIDPIAALAENKDWTGKPIAREDFNKLAPTPGFSRAKDTASEFSKAVSKGLNWLSGGSNYRPGIFSPTPDQIDYLIGQVTGGLGRETMKIEQTISSTFTGEELPTYKIPLLGRFYGSSEGQAQQGGTFYTNLRELNEHEAEIKGRHKAGEPIGEYLRENPEARLYRYANHVERQVSALRRKRRELIERDADREQIKAIDNRITSTMTQFNQRVRSVREHMREAA